MRTRVVETLATVLVLSVGGAGLAQQAEPPKSQFKVEIKPAPAKSKLEEMLAEALKHNPDIRVAEAKLAEADAELNRTRLQVTQKVIALHHALLSQKAAVEYEQKKFERVRELLKRAAINTATLDEAQQALTLAKAKLTELEAQMPALLGKTAHSGDGQPLGVLLRTPGTRFYPLIGQAELTLQGGDLVLIQPRAERAAGPMADRIRQALDKPIELILNKEVESVCEVVPEVLEKQTGIMFKFIAEGLPNPKLKLELTKQPLRAILQYLEDCEPGYRFVIREYGILFAPELKLPPGALTVQEFLRQKPAGKEK